jgi:hypothetical protein
VYQKDLSSMFTVTSASTRLSQRIAKARAHHRAASAERSVPAARRTSFGETLAVGLGCDRW